MNVVQLEVTFPDGRIETVFVDAERILIGSGAHCDVRLPGELAAHEHIAIEILGETVRVEALSFEPAPTLDGNVVRRAALVPGSILGIGALEIRVTPSAVVGDAERVRKERAASGSAVVRMAMVAVVALGALGVIFFNSRAAASAPIAPPELFADTAATCATNDAAQARSLSLEKRVAADGKRERYPFYVEEGVEAVSLYEQASACFRTIGDIGASDELAAVARQLRKEVTDDARTRRLRLERALITGDREVGAREVVALRALYTGKRGPYVEWISAVARKLDVDKEQK